MSFAVFLFWAGVVRDFMPRGNPPILIVCHSIVGGRWWAFLLWSLTLICLFYAVSFAMVFFCQFVCHGRGFDGFSELQPNIINCLQDSSFKIFLVMLVSPCHGRFIAQLCLLARRGCQSPWDWSGTLGMYAVEWGHGSRTILVITKIDPRGRLYIPCYYGFNAAVLGIQKSFFCL